MTYPEWFRDQYRKNKKKLSLEDSSLETPRRLNYEGYGDIVKLFNEHRKTQGEPMPGKFPIGGETVTNDRGGKQSDIPTRFDLIPAIALARVAQTLKIGADKYGEENWRNIEKRDNINHAIGHLYAYLAGDFSEDHLTNATCRALFALELEFNPNDKDYPRKQNPVDLVPQKDVNLIPLLYDQNGTCKECGADCSSHEGLTNKFGTSHPICINCGEFFRTHEDSRCVPFKLNSMQIASNKIYRWSPG